MSIRYQDLNLNADQSTYEYLTKDLLGEKKICTIFKAINVIPPFFNFLSPSVKVTEVFQKIQFKSTNEYLFIYFNPLKLKIMKQIAFEAFQVNNVESLKNNYFFEYINLMIFSVYFYIKNLGFISQKGDEYIMRNQIRATIRNINKKEVDKKKILEDIIHALNVYLAFAANATIDNLSISKDSNKEKKNILSGLDTIKNVFVNKLTELKGWYDYKAYDDKPTMDTKNVLNWLDIDNEAKEKQLDLTTERILQLYTYYHDKKDRNTPLKIYYNELLHPKVNVVTVLEGGKPTEKIEDGNRQQDPVETVTLQLFDPKQGTVFQPRAASQLAPAVQFLNLWKYVYRETGKPNVETDFINPKGEMYKVQLQINVTKNFQIKNVIKNTLDETWQKAKETTANGTTYLNLWTGIEKKIKTVDPETKYDGEYKIKRKIGYTDNAPDNLIITCTASETVYFENEDELFGFHDIEMLLFNKKRKQNTHNYTLVAFILYSQAKKTESSYGHYTACVRRADSWYFINDSDVFQINKWNLKEGSFSYNGGNKELNIRQMFYENVDNGLNLLTEKPIGIENTTGVACYINASIQCFMTLDGIGKIANKRQEKENASTPRVSNSNPDSSNKTTPPSSKNRNNKKSSTTPRTVKPARKRNKNENLIFRVVHHEENLEYIYLSASKKFLVVEKFKVGNRYNYGEEQYEVVTRVSDEIVLKKVVQQKTKKRKKGKNKKSEEAGKKKTKKTLEQLIEERDRILDQFRLNSKKLYSLEEQINNTLKF